MRLRRALALIYLILVTMMGVFILSTLYVALKKDYSYQILFDAAQSVLALLLFVIIARLTTLSELMRGVARNGWLILFSFFISIVGGFVGYLLYDTFSPFILPLIGTLKQQAQHFDSMSPHARPIFLFSNNMRVASMTGLFFGSLPFGGFFAPFMLLVNGALIGFIAHLPTSSALLLLAGLTPHGVFEVPALYLASAAGLRINIAMFRGLATVAGNYERIRQNMESARGAVPTPPSSMFDTFLFALRNDEDTRRELNDALDAIKLFALIVPLLIVAALIESYLTPLVLKWVGF